MMSSRRPDLERAAVPHRPLRTDPRPWLLVPLLAALLGPPAQSQEPTARQEFGEETTVTVVEVPVQVLDREGRPVRGLTAEDFVVYDEGERRPVRFFDVVDLREVEVGAAAEPEEAAGTGVEDGEEVSTAARRHLLLFFDLEFTPPRFVAEAQRAALDLVRDGLRPTDLVAVTFFHGRSGTSSVVGFTSDRDQVIRALEALGEVVGGEGGDGEEGDGVESAASEPSVQGDPLGLTFRGWDVGRVELGRFTTAERSLADETLDWYAGGGGGGGRAPDGVGETLADMADYAEEDLRQQRAARASTLVEALRATARQTRFLEGAKHLMLFSQGFESTLYTEQGQSWLQRELEAMIDELQRAGWSVHGIDLGEVGGDFRRRQKRESLAMMADSTGGSVHASASDPAAAIGRVMERTSVTYVLGFQTGEIPMDGSFRRLRVELADGPKRTALHHRAGYFTPRDPSVRDAETWRAVAAEMLLGAEERDEIGVTVLAAPTERTPAGARVPVIVQIGGAGLASGAVSGPRRTELYLYSFDPSGAVEVARTGQVALDPGRLPDPSGGFKLLQELSLAPGRHQVRVLVRDADTGRVALRVMPVTVPGASEESVLLPPMFLQRSEEPWVVVRGGGQGDGQGEEASFPFVFRGSPFVPSAEVTMEVGGRRALLVMGYDLPPGAFGLRVRVVDAAGRAVDGASVALASRDPGTGGAPDVMALELGAGELPPGSYAVEAMVGQGGKWVRGARFRVVGR